MEIIKEGIIYKLNNFSNREDYQVISFVEKIPSDGSSIERFQDGTTNEEVLYMLIDRLNYLNTKHYSIQNKIAKDALKTALNALKIRNKNKSTNKRAYQDRLNQMSLENNS